MAFSSVQPPGDVSRASAGAAPSTSPESTSDAPWFHQFAQAPFPISLLPTWLGEYVNCLASHYLLRPEALAPLLLAQLAGALAEHRCVRSQTGAPVGLPFSVIVAAREASTLSMALVESSKALAELQQAHLDVASGFDRKRAEELMQKPRMALPADAMPTRSVEPQDVDKWRARLVRLYQMPMFWLEHPGSKELRAGFAGSFDRTLLVTFAKGGWLEKLVSPKRDREANRLGDLLASLARGGHLSMPATPRNPAAPKVSQARFGLAALTASDALAQALKDERDDVRALLAHCVLLSLPDSSNLQASRPSVDRLQQAGAAWKHRITSLLTERRAPEPSGFGPHDCFHRRLVDWQARLHNLGQQIPASLRRHLAAFVELPLKLGSLLLAIGHYGVWKDDEAAQAALRITEWMLGRTLLCAATAQESHRRHVMTDACEKMLVKIVQLGPIDFWRLCRHFDVQTKALHEPTLHALLDEKRVRLNEDGKLVAA